MPTDNCKFIVKGGVGRLKKPPAEGILYFNAQGALTWKGCVLVAAAKIPAIHVRPLRRGQIQPVFAGDSFSVVPFWWFILAHHLVGRCGVHLCAVPDVLPEPRCSPAGALRLFAVLDAP